MELETDARTAASDDIFFQVAKLHLGETKVIVNFGFCVL